jgi:hypothetical protein
MRETCDRKMGDILANLERIDTERVDATKKLLQRAVEIQRATLDAFSKSLEDTHRVVEGIDSASDIVTYCAELRTGREREPPLEFEEYIRRDGQALHDDLGRASISQ